MRLIILVALLLCASACLTREQKGYIAQKEVEDYVNDAALSPPETGITGVVFKIAITSNKTFMVYYQDTSSLDVYKYETREITFNIGDTILH